MIDRVVSTWFERAGKPVRSGGRGRRSALPGLLRAVMCHVLAVWAVLAFAHGATAATLPEPVRGAGEEPLAPICDAIGASAGVRAEVPEVDHGRFEALPCEGGITFADWPLSGHDNGREAASVRAGASHVPLKPPLDHGRPDGAWAFGFSFPERQAPSIIAAPLTFGLGSSPGHRSAVFRPPLLCGFRARGALRAA
jgi:hypothetical protein